MGAPAPCSVPTALQSAAPCRPLARPRQGTIFWTNVYGVPTPWAPFTPYHKLREAQREHLGRLMRGSTRPPLVGGQAYSTWFNTQSRLTGPLPEEGVKVGCWVAAGGVSQAAACSGLGRQLHDWCAHHHASFLAWSAPAALRPAGTAAPPRPQALARYFSDAADACAANASSVACHCSMGGHVLGGAYARAPADASAFPFRDKLFILNGMVSLPTAVAEAAPPELLAEAVQLNNDFLR